MNENEHTDGRTVRNSESARVEAPPLEGPEGQESSQHLYSQRASDLPTESEAGPIERLHFVTVLKDMTTRLGALEEKVAKDPVGKTRGNSFLEFLKILLGGWPAFGILFILLFYLPLKEALKAIPDKVKAAEEIQVAGVSLKTTIKKVASSRGLEGLGETIPRLSSHAIELLLRGPRDGESLVSFTMSDDHLYSTDINLPSESVMKSLGELQEKGLIELKGGLETEQQLDGTKLKQLTTDIKNKFPGHAETTAEDDRLNWKLKNPLPAGYKGNPRLMWKLTDTGSQAVGLILKAISTQLVQAEAPTGK